MKSEIKTAGRLLFFRATAEELRGLNLKHFALGIVMTWLVGIGRWWEDPRASALQHSGIGSVVYVFFLSFFLWLLLWPIAPKGWSLTNVLAFVSLTSPPAILYAIPVRHGLELQTAQTIRLWMLAIVAGWRVALLGFYLRRGADFAPGRLMVALLFPLTLIVFTLTALNLEKVVFDIMGGVHPQDRTVNDTAYGVLILITMLSMLAFIPLFAAYLILSVSSLFARFDRRAAFFIFPVALIFGVVGVFIIPENVFLLRSIVDSAAVVIAGSAAFEMHYQKKQKVAEIGPPKNL